MTDDPTPQGESPENVDAPREPNAEQPSSETPAQDAPVAEEQAAPVAAAEDAAQEPASREQPAETAAQEQESTPVAAQEPAPEAVAGAEPAAEAPAVAEPVAEAPAADEPAGEAQPSAEGPAAAEPAGERPAPAAGAPTAEAGAAEPAASPAVAGEPAAAEEDFEEEDEEPAPRVKPAVPGAHLEVDIVPEGADPLGRDAPADPYAIDDEEPTQSEEQDAEELQALAEPISTAAIDLAAGARYRATGKRKTAIARVILRPGTGAYLVNGRALEEHFPRQTLQRNIRQPLETVGYQERMDVVARVHGGGISAQAGALRHGISRALLEADPNLRGELKRRGFLTRDSRAKERKKAGLKKARKRPQFSKR
jgi:small subunit ribosomal protein S9